MYRILCCCRFLQHWFLIYHFQNNWKCKLSNISPTSLYNDIMYTGHLIINYINYTNYNIGTSMCCSSLSGISFRKRISWYRSISQRLKASFQPFPGDATAPQHVGSRHYLTDFVFINIQLVAHAQTINQTRSVCI